MSAPPSRNSIAGTGANAPSNATARTGFGALWDYVTTLLGATGDAVDARTALGLGTAATSASTAFATSTQGGKADTALQPAAVGSTVQAYDAATAKLNVAQQFSARQRTTPVTDNDLSFDLAAGNDFYCTPTGGATLTFTNITAGCKGEVLLVNGANYAIAKASAVKCPATMLATISATGRYRLAYSSLDGTNVDVTASSALS